MKLYDLPKDTWFTLCEEPTEPPDIRSTPLNTTKEYKLKNIDGMYSYVVDTEDRVYHFAAWTEVSKIG